MCSGRTWCHRCHRRRRAQTPPPPPRSPPPHSSPLPSPPVALALCGVHRSRWLLLRHLLLRRRTLELSSPLLSPLRRRRRGCCRAVSLRVERGERGPHARAVGSMAARRSAASGRRRQHQQVLVQRTQPRVATSGDGSGERQWLFPASSGAEVLVHRPSRSPKMAPPSRRLRVVMATYPRSRRVLEPSLSARCPHDRLQRAYKPATAAAACCSRVRPSRVSEFLCDALFFVRRHATLFFEAAPRNGGVPPKRAVGFRGPQN